MNLGLSIGTRESMRSFAGGGGLGGVRVVLNPQVARRINGILVIDIIRWCFGLGSKKTYNLWPFLASTSITCQKYSEPYLTRTVFVMKKSDKSIYLLLVAAPQYHDQLRLRPTIKLASNFIGFSVVGLVFKFLCHILGHVSVSELKRCTTVFCLHRHFNYYQERN